jgi:hypothetical protein
MMLNVRHANQDTMKLASTGYPKSQRIAATKRELKAAFSDIEHLNIYVGGLTPRFAFDSRCTRRPRFTGEVVASLSVARDLTAIMELYPISRGSYDALAARHFALQIVPSMKQWLLAQCTKPRTAILGCEQMIVEWIDKGHRAHYTRYL